MVFSRIKKRNSKRGSSNSLKKSRKNFKTKNLIKYE